jgi:cytochrome c oxidase subunit 2
VADKPGRYRGQCAEYCGLQHAHMAFDVVAMPPRQFEAWLARESQPAAEPQTPAASHGRDLFVSSSCAGCHRIRGTEAAGELGPDLTHLASRATIGAGLLPLTPGNLADFVANPQDDKPGATMPPTEITPHELDDLVEYLMQLK